MHILVEDLTGLWRRIVITISCDYMNNLINKKIKNLSKTMRIAGFRVGKVPISIIEQKYGSAIRQDTINNLMEQNLISCITKNKIKLVSKPQYQILESCDNINKNFIYSVTAEVYPKIQLKGLNNNIIVKPVVKITEHDIDFIINTAKQQDVFWVHNDTKQISIGDRITFSITAQSNDATIMQDIDFNSIENIILIIGQNSNHDTISHLEKNMIGCITGDKFDIHISFPNDYYIVHLIHKCVSFVVTIKKIETVKFSKLHQDYFQYYDRSKIRQNIQRDLNKFIEQNIKNQIINNILLSNNFDIPITLMQNELHILKNRNKTKIYYIDNRLSEKPLYSLILEEFNLKYQARRRVQFLLLFNEIIQYNKLNVDHKSVLQSMEKFLDTLGYSKKIMRSLRNNVAIKKYVNSILLEELVIDFIIKRSKFMEQECTFSKLVSVNQLHPIIDCI